MDQEQWQQQNRFMGGGGGSVRRARERAENGDSSQIPIPVQRGLTAPRNAGPNMPMNRIRPPMPIVLGSRSGQVPGGIAISRPIQPPQWPLAGSIEGEQDSRNYPQYQQPQIRVPDQRNNTGYSPPQNRGPAPKRPPRPSEVPTMPDNQDYRYAPGLRFDQEPFSPEISSPMTQSSGQSILSSVGSIPDFPAPMQPGPARRSANLGPPPSSRRGASSYYSQASFVSPIPEESPRPSHQSYASSAAIPTSWGSNSPREYDYDEADYEDEEIPDYGSRFENGTIEEVRGESRGSNGDDSDDRGLIRSASFGRRAKPSMIVTRSSERIEPVRPTPAPQQNMTKLDRMGMGEPAGLAAPRMPAGQRETIWPDMDRDDPLSSGTGLIDPSSSSSESVPTLGAAITINEPSPSYTPSPSDSKKSNAMLSAYNQASALSPGGPLPLRTPSPGFSRLSAIRRPPRLNIDAVRDAEARGSLTSLPDLIARATRLAAMMDRGKRPGSRMALDDFSSESGDKEMGILRDEKHKSGLSGMLAAFPPPGVQTPRGGTPNRPNSAWPSGYGPSDAGPGEKAGKKQRRCCGLPLWGFLLVLFLLLIAAAAAVVVPLEFLVFNKKSTSTATLTAVQQCEASTTAQCKNGGTSILDNGACACICTNGFTGSTCTSANATGCSTTTLSGVTGNVTLGDAIYRIITGAQNFSIPLEGKTIVARFNANSLSCATENALVTFDGQSGRVGQAGDVVRATGAATSSKPTATSATRLKHKHRRDTSSSSAPVATATSGIVFDSSTPPTTSTTSIIVDSSTTTTTSSSAAESLAAANPTGLFPITEEVLDFARVAVLYILQQGTLDGAISAQSTLQRFFTLESFTNAAAMNVSLGNDAFADLVGFSVNIGGVGSVGGKNASATVVSRRMVGRGVWVPPRPGSKVDGRSVKLWEV